MLITKQIIIPKYVSVWVTLNNIAINKFATVANPIEFLSCNVADRARRNYTDIDPLRFILSLLYSTFRFGECRRAASLADIYYFLGRTWRFLSLIESLQRAASVDDKTSCHATHFFATLRTLHNNYFRNDDLHLQEACLALRFLLGSSRSSLLARVPANFFHLRNERTVAPARKEFAFTQTPHFDVITRVFMKPSTRDFPDSTMSKL